MSWPRVGLIAAVAVFLTVVFWPGGFGGGPTYQDRKERTASEWLVAGSDGGESPTNVVEAFRAMGRDGVLFLAQTLKMPLRERIGRVIFHKYNPPVWLGEALSKVLNLPDGMDDPRLRAANMLSQLGPMAEPALPEMLRIFRRGDNDDPVTQQVAEALKSMGEKMAFMVPELIQGLKGTNWQHAIACAEILGAIGPKARPALPALLNATNADCWLAQSAAFAIWDIDRQTNVVVEFLDHSVKNHTQNRGSALNVLRRRGIALEAAAPVLQQALYDPAGGVRDEAERTLQQINPERLQATIDQLNQNAPLILQQSIAVLESGKNKIPYHAFIVIKFFGPKAESAVPALIEMLNQEPPDPSSDVMNFAAVNKYLLSIRQALPVIEAIGPAARDAVPALTNLLERTNRFGIREFEVDVCNALGSIGPAASEAVPVLEALLTRTNESIRFRGNDTVHFAAARALVEIAPGLTSTAVKLLKKEEGEQEKSHFVEIAPSPNKAKRGRGLVPLAWHPSSQALSAQVVLWKAGMEKNPPVTNLMSILSKGFDPNAKLAAIQLLAEVGTEARPALPLLETFLKPGENLRWDAAIAIQRIDPQEAARLGLPGLLPAY